MIRGALQNWQTNKQTRTLTETLSPATQSVVKHRLWSMAQDDCLNNLTYTLNNLNLRSENLCCTCYFSWWLFSCFSVARLRSVKPKNLHDLTFSDCEHVSKSSSLFDFHEILTMGTFSTVMRTQVWWRCTSTRSKKSNRYRKKTKCYSVFISLLNFHFYWTRVRSLFTLVTNWLTD